jgi:hypothetical protein
MGKYLVRHTVDQLGGRYESPEGIEYTTTDSLSQAEQEAERLTADGQCGVVVRVADGAVRAPDGTWII